MHQDSAQFNLNLTRIKMNYCNPRYSTMNGQTERIHSKIIEIAKCLKEKLELINDVEIIISAHNRIIKLFNL